MEKLKEMDKPEDFVLIYMKDIKKERTNNNNNNDTHYNHFKFNMYNKIKRV